MDVIKLAQNLRRVLLVFVFHSLIAPLRARSAVAVPVFALTLVSGFAASGAQAGTTAVGAVAGSGGVTSSGAATYSIPISLPPGTNGMQPSLALVYNSQSGDGLAGYDWTLSGFSVITRCPQNYDDDGQTRPVEFVQSDDYCLDGQKLIGISGTYGADGTTYDTQVASFAVVTSHGSQASAGPGYFTVQTKDGRTYEYGKTSDSTILASGVGSGNVPRIWALDKVTDGNGNSMSYAYSGNADGSSYWPVEIDYTANGSTAADHQVLLNYAVREVPSNAQYSYESNAPFDYEYGALITNTRVLTSIQVNYASSTFTYNLGYNNDPVNNRYQLSTVQECGADGSCLPETVITWQSAQAGWGADQSTNITAPGPSGMHLVDVDGDGIKDLVYPGTTDWMVAFGKPSGGFTAPYDTGVAVTAQAMYSIALDYNGDGLTDIAVPIASGGWLLLESTGNRVSGAQGIFLTPSNNLPNLSATNPLTTAPIYVGNVWPGLYSAGLGAATDIIYCDGTNVNVSKNLGISDGWRYSAGAPVYSVGTSHLVGENVSPTLMDAGMDFDGSGRASGLLEDQLTTFSSTTYSLDALTVQNNGNMAVMGSIPYSTEMAPIPLDANGDGITDILSVNPSLDLQLSLSMGNGGFNTLTTTQGINYLGDPVVADYFADGKEEAIVASDINTGITDWYLLNAQYTPNGQGGTITANVISESSAPYPYNNTGTSGGVYAPGSLRVGNIEANGYDDLVYGVWNSSLTTMTWHYELHNGYGKASDVVTSVIQGVSNQTDVHGNPLGNTTTFTYDSLANADGVYTEGNGSSGNPYPIQNVQPAQQVVSQFGYTPMGGQNGYTLSYTYTGLQYDTIRRMSLGFSSRTITDSRSGNVETLSYDQNFFWDGMVTNDNLAKSAGGLIRTVANTGQGKLQEASGVAYSFFDSSETDDYDTVNGSVTKIRSTVTAFDSTQCATSVTSEFDQYANLTCLTTTMTDVIGGTAFKTTTTSTLATETPNSLTYCEDLPLTTVVTKTSPGGTASRNMAFTNNITSPTCLNTGSTLSPGTSAGGSPSITTAYPSFDAWGNATEVDITGTSAAERKTTYVYTGGNNEFPTTTKVYNGSQIIATYATWNYAFGVETSVTDPNSNVTNMTYDAYGRLQQTTRPDGSASQQTLYWCSSAPFACPASASYEVATSQVSAGTGATTILTGYAAYDSLGRVVEQGSVLLGGALSVVDTTYDAFGHAVTVTKPYLASSSPAPTIYTTTYSYDPAMNRLTQASTPENQSDTCSSGCGNVVTISHNDFTTTTSQTVTDSASSSSTQATTQTVDAIGEVTTVVDAKGGSTSYTYLPFGELNQTTDADGNQTTLTYDGLGNKTQMADPNMGTWTYQADALGDILCQTDANNQSIIMNYDGFGRVTSKLETAAGAGCTATTGTLNSWTYDSAPQGVGLPVSAIQSVVTSGGSTQTYERDYDYDSLSRPMDVTTTIDGTPYTVSTIYDAFGRVSTVSYPASVTPTSSGGAPTAVAKASPTSTTIGTPVTLDGTSSTPNTATLQYQWTQTPHTGGPSLDMQFDSAAAKPSFTPSVGGIYSFQLQVIDTSTGLSAPASVSVTVVPPAPSAPSLSPNPSNTGSVTLTWASVPNAASYGVYQSTDDAHFTKVQTVNDSGTGSNTATVTGLVTGTYYYALSTTTNDGVSGAFGAAATESVVVVTAPLTPAGLTTDGDPNHDGSYTVSWNSVTVTGLAPPDQITYNLEEAGGTASQQTTGYSVVNSCTGTSTSCSISHASNTYYYYYYRVRAGDVEGYSAYSPATSINVIVRPSVPSSISPTSEVSYTQSNTVSWGSSSPKVTEYQLYRATNSSFSGETNVYDGTARSYSDSVPSVNTYYYRVRACNESGSTEVCSNWESYAYINVESFTGCPPGQKCGLVKQAPAQPTGAPTQSTSVPPQPTTAPAPSTAQPATSSLTPATQQIRVNLEAQPGLQTVVLVPATTQPLDMQPRSPASRASNQALASQSLVQLSERRQRLVAGQPLQPAEQSLQAKRDALLAEVDAALAPPGYAMPGSQPTAGLDGRPRYAPPVYAAYAGAHLRKVSSSPYRFAVQYNYDPSSGGLLSVSDASTQFIYWRAATENGIAPVDAFGHIIAYTDGNNVSTVSAYDGATGAVTGISTGIGSASAVQLLAYHWDGFGNLKQRCDANRGLTEGFTYDALNRLSNSTVNTGASSCGSGTQGTVMNVQYDNVGNIAGLSNSGNPNVGGAYKYDTADGHPYAASTVGNIPTTYQYDSNGNMTSGNGRTITWNDDNLPVSITSSGTVNGNNTVTGTSTFSYDPGNQRYVQTAFDNTTGLTTTTAYVGSLFEVVSNSSGTQYRHNIIAMGQVVAVHTLDQSGNPTTDYIHTDHLGSGDAITDQTGNIATDPVTGEQQVMSFDAFGMRRDPNTWGYDLTGAQISGLKAKTNRGFTYQEQLDNVALVHMNGRVYDPSIGRMISADPTIPQPFNSQAYNRYAYVYNNPLAFTDPTGYCGTEWYEVVCQVTSAASNAASSAASTAANALGNAGTDLAHAINNNSCFADCFWQPYAPLKGLNKLSNSEVFLLTGLTPWDHGAVNHSAFELQNNRDVQIAAAIVAAYFTWGASEAYLGFSGAEAAGAAGAVGSATYTAESGGTPSQVIKSGVAGGLLFYGGYELVYGAAGWTSLSQEVPYAAGAADGAYGAYSAAKNGEDLAQIEANTFFHGMEGYSLGSLGSSIYGDTTGGANMSFSQIWDKYATPRYILQGIDMASWTGAKDWFVNARGEDMGLTHTEAWDIKSVLDVEADVGPP